MASTSALPAEDAVTTIERLFPLPSVATADRRSGPAAERSFIALPSIAKARVILPNDPSLAAASLRRARRPVSRRSRATTSAICLLLRVGVSRLLPHKVYVSGGAGASIEDLLADVLGE